MMVYPTHNIVQTRSSSILSDHMSFFIGTYLMALMLCGCDQNVKTSVPKNNGNRLKSDMMISSPMTTTAVTDTVPPIDCPRGAAEPVVKTSVFPNTNFKLQADCMTGIETFTLPKGDQVKITQSGCEYYILKFHIETSRFASDTANIPYWSNAAIILMREICKGISTPLEISKGLEKLSVQRNTEKLNAGNLKVGDEIDFGGSDPREYFTLDRISQPGEHRYLIEMTFSYGPI